MRPLIPVSNERTNVRTNERTHERKLGIFFDFWRRATHRRQKSKKMLNENLAFFSIFGGGVAAAVALALALAWALALALTLALAEKTFH